MLERPLTKRSSANQSPADQPSVDQSTTQRKRISWRIAISIVLSLAVLLLAYIRRDKVWAAIGLLDQAQPIGLLVGFALILLSFYSAAHVYDRALRSTGHKLSMLRLWATAIVAILLSQAVPGGGLASYAFLVETFRRRGIALGSAALVASLEAVSYVIAMLIFFMFSVVYLIFHSSADVTSGSLLAGGVALAVIGTAIFVLTRSADMLQYWLITLSGGVMRLLRRPWGAQQVAPLIEELVRARGLVAERWGELILLVLIQLTTLMGHSLAMLVVIWSLGASASFAAVVTAFGVALITSTFNVLPGGGGTVEAVLTLTLSQLGAGDEALAAAVIFRILNFWLLMPIAVVCYRWLMRQRDAVTTE